MIFLSPSEEKNLAPTRTRKITEMNPEEMELAYVAPWEKAAFAASSARLVVRVCGFQWRRPGSRKKEDRGQKSKPSMDG
jgi:hypothetical protein